MTTSKATQTSSHLEQCEGLSQDWLLMRGAHDLRMDDILVDVILVVDGVKMEPCHKFMLAASSPYFRAMFTHGMVEQDKKEIDIMGMDPGSLRLVLDYIYSGQITITDFNVQGVMTACSLLQIVSLYAKCRDYMIMRLDTSNCVSVYQFARSMYCTKLEEEAFRFITKRFNDVAQTHEFTTLSKEELIDVICSDDLWVTHEESVYEAALHWLASDIIQRSHLIVEVFSHIRFALMDEKFLDECVLQEELMFEYSQLRAQIEAVKEYKSNLARSIKETQEIDSNQPNATKTDTETSGCDNVEPSSFPYYTVSVSGVENVIRIPLSIQPRLGMNTKEFLLFSNGRRTFVMNPNGTSEYYGCIESQSQIEDSLASGQKVIPAGWSPNIPLMKNPEAYVTSDGTAYLLGGLEIEKTSPPNVRTRVYYLEPDTLRWMQCPSMPVPRCMAAYGDGCGHLYVMGGKALSQGEVVSSVHKYSRIENEWEEVPPMPIAVYGHGSASLKNKIFVIGGKTTAKVLLSNVHVLDCVTHQWIGIESLTVPRFLHGVTINHETEELYVVGGSSEDGVLSSVEVFHTSEKRWRFGESFPGNRCAQYVMFFGGHLHAVGGYVTERSDSGRYESREMHDIFILNSETDQWARKVRRVKGTTAGSMSCIKVSLNMTKMPRSKVLFE